MRCEGDFEREVEVRAGDAKKTGKRGVRGIYIRSSFRFHMKANRLSGMSPTVFREGPYRGYFFSHEPNEPAHVHVDRDGCTAKFWLEPVGLAYNLGFKASELRQIEIIVRRNSARCKEVWDEFFAA